MKKNVPNKAYEIVMLITLIFALLNIGGLWVTWNNSKNYFGYISGIFTLLGLLACGIMNLFNEKVVSRKHCIIHFSFALAHIVFFSICWYLGGEENKAAPALFTVLLAAIAIVDAYLLLKDRVNRKHESYNFDQPKEESKKPSEEESYSKTETIGQPAQPDKPTDDGKTTVISF